VKTVPTLAGALRSELAATLRARSSRRLLLAALGLSVGLAMAVNALELYQANWGAQDHCCTYSVGDLLGQFDPTPDSLRFLVAGLLPMMAFGAVACIRGHRYEVITRPSTPRARLAAKVIVVAVIALLAGEIISLAAFFLGELAFGLVVTGSLARSADLQAVIAGGIFLGAGGMLGFGLAAVQRAIAPAASKQVVLAVTSLVWIAAWIAKVLPAAVGQWLPFQVGARITSITPGHGFGPWTVLAVFCGYTAVIVVMGLAAGSAPRRSLPAWRLSNRKNALSGSPTVRMPEAR
jgi:hypothetical protein